MLHASFSSGLHDQGPHTVVRALAHARSSLQQQVRSAGAAPDGGFPAAFAHMVAAIEAVFRQEETLMERIGFPGVREQRRVRHPGWPRWFRWLVDTALAAWQVSRGKRRFDFRLQLERRALPHPVSAVLVTNNPLAGPRERRSFDRGLLALHVPSTQSPIDLMSVALRAALLGPTPAEPFALEPLDIVLTKHARLWTFPRIPIALDGEVRPAASSLELKSLPGALRVRVPRSQE